MTFEALVADLFPYGVAHYLVGGILVGLGVVVIYLGTALIPGASTFLESTLSYVSDRDRFQQPRFLSTRDWRVVFSLGIVAGAAVYALTFQTGLLTNSLQPGAHAGELRDLGWVTIWVTEVQWWRLLGGGILIGIGTRLGKGCTSGHGVCGVGSRSPTSILNVVIFMAFAIATALLVAALGVTP